MTSGLTTRPATESRTPRRFAALIGIGSLLGLGACAGASSSLPIQKRASPIARIPGGAPAHIAVIALENKEYRDILGSRSAPFVNSLARRFALATQMYATRHPSLPNYIALTSGSTHGIDSDCTHCSVRGSGLVGQLTSRRISWKAYMEDLPHPCFKGATARGYAKKHDPFLYYTSIARNSSLCNQVVPLGELSGDEQQGALPRFIWITPNLCHDMHDCGRSQGDRFLSRMVPPLLHVLGPRGLLILTWDEGSSDNGCCRFASGGHIVTILAGDGAREHARLKTPTDHYSILQTIEDLLGVRRLGHARCACTPTLAPLLARR